MKKLISLALLSVLLFAGAGCQSVPLGARTQDSGFQKKDVSGTVSSQLDDDVVQVDLQGANIINGGTFGLTTLTASTTITDTLTVNSLVTSPLVVGGTASTTIVGDGTTSTFGGPISIQDSSKTKTLSLKHDGTNGSIETTSGNLNFNPDGADVGFSGKSIIAVGSNITGTKNVPLTMSVIGQETDDADGVGMNILGDAGGSGGSGNHRGGDIYVGGGPKTGSGVPGYIKISAPATNATNYHSIMTQYSLWIQGYLEVNNASRFNSSATFGSGFTSTLTTAPTAVGSSGSFGGGFYTLAGQTVATSDATVTDLSTIAVAEKDVWLVRSDIVATKTDGTDRALYTLQGLFYRNTGGNVTQQGATVVIGGIESDATWNADLVADTVAQTVDVRVTGKAATAIRWKATTSYQRVTLP